MKSSFPISLRRWLVVLALAFPELTGAQESPPIEAKKALPITQYKKADLWPLATGTPFSAPSSGELISLITRTLSPRWRQIAPLNAIPLPANRSQAALLLGSVLAHLNVAIELRDLVWVKQLSQDTASLERALGIADHQRPRIAHLVSLGEANAWSSLRQEIEATAAEQRQGLERQRDEDLGRLIALGTWITALDWEITAHLAKSKTETAILASQSVDFLAWMRRVLEALPASVKSDKAVQSCRQLTEKLGKMEKGETTASSEEIARALKETLTKIRSA